MRRSKQGFQMLVPLKPLPREEGIRLLNEMWQGYTWDEILEIVHKGSE